MFIFTVTVRVRIKLYKIFLELFGIVVKFDIKF